MKPEEADFLERQYDSRKKEAIRELVLKLNELDLWSIWWEDDTLHIKSVKSKRQAIMDISNYSLTECVYILGKMLYDDIH